MKTAGIYLALRGFVMSGNGMRSISNANTIFKEYRAVPCVPVGMLRIEGVVASCEEICCTVSMMMLSLLSGRW